MKVLSGHGVLSMGVLLLLTARLMLWINTRTSSQYLRADTDASAASNATNHQPSVISVWPAPRGLVRHGKRRHVVFLDDFTFRTNCSDCQNLFRPASLRFTTALSNLVRPKTKGVDHQSSSPLTHLRLLGLQINVGEYTDLQFRPDIVDESYSLQIFDDHNVATNNSTPSPDAKYIHLEAPTVFGALCGFQTLLQLLQFDGWWSPAIEIADAESTDQQHAVFSIDNTPLEIHDAPAYAHRGLMIDTARHYLPVNLILQNLQAMEYNKLNVLHWHLTDSQSWPWASQSHPELAEAGAYCPTCIYTEDDIERVIYEAILRGIFVIPEVDVPGHSQAIGKSHPELLTQCYKEDGTPQWSEPLDVTKPATRQLVREVYDEVFDNWPDSWVHVGGDEVGMDCWKNSSSIQAWMARHGMNDTVRLLADFENDVLHQVASNNKTAIVWQDLMDSNISLPTETVIDVWKDWLHMNETLFNATKQGHRVLLSACWYLDHLKQTWWDFYQCDPRSHLVNATVAQKALLLGGHASMWGEMVDETNLLTRVWPRASSMAEKLWTGRNKKATKTAESRLERFRCFLLSQSIPAGPIGPGICPGEFGPDFVDSMSDATSTSTTTQ